MVFVKLYRWEIGPTPPPRAGMVCGKFCTAGTVADLVVLYAIPGTLSPVCARHVKRE